MSNDKSNILIFMSEWFWIKLLEIDENTNAIEKIIERDNFRVSNTEMTYRQINYLDKVGLLGSGREDTDAGWRMFKFRDIVYLHILNELKRFGIPNSKLKGLHSLFYEQPSQSMNEVILACFGGAEMTIILNSKGGGYVFNPNYLNLYDDGIFRDEQDGAEIRIKVNTAVNLALKDMGKPPMKITMSVSKAFSEMLLNKPSEAEQKVLEVLRDKSYEVIKIKKRDGKPKVLYAETSSKSNITEQELMAEIAKNNFSDVQIKKRDGKVVHYKQEKTIKL